MKSIYILLLLASLFSGCDSNNLGNTPKTNLDEDSSLERVKKAGVLLWGADVIGGIPYVYEDPDNPGTFIGFEMDIANSIAQSLGVNQQLVIKAWDTLIPELQNKSFDIGMNGIEDTEDRSHIVKFSQPYYLYTQQITVRKDTQGIMELDDLKGKTVATLSGTAAEDILRSIPEINVRINPEIIYSYQDLEEGKVDAVVLDTPIASAYGATNPKLKNVGPAFGEGRYVIAFRGEDKALLDAINQALTKLKASGELGKIYKKWGIMNTHQQKVGIQ